MKKFEFDTQKTELEICGKKYTINLDYNTNKKCDDIQKKAKEMFEQLSKNKNAVTDDELCKFLLDGIDKMLGKGSSAEIFKGRKKNFVDASRLFNFIIGEITAELRKNLNILGEN